MLLHVRTEDDLDIRLKERERGWEGGFYREGGGRVQGRPMRDQLAIEIAKLLTHLDDELAHDIPHLHHHEVGLTIQQIEAIQHHVSYRVYDFMNTGIRCTHAAALTKGPR